MRRARRARGATGRFLQISESRAHALWLVSNLQALDYAQAHSRNTLLVGLDDFVEHGDKLPGLLNRRLQVDLKAVPVRKALKKDLLHREPATKQPRRIADAVQRLERQATSLA